MTDNSAQPPKDFYTTEKGLASFIEKEWAEFFSGSVPVEFPPFDPGILRCGFHHDVARMARRLCPPFLIPHNLLDIGAAVGKGVYELCKAFPSIREATLIEPSELLFDALDAMLTRGQVHRFPILWGNGAGSKGIQTIEVDARSVVEAMDHVDISLVHLPIEEAQIGTGQFDIASSLNVLDQCADPQFLMNSLKAAVKPGGMAIVSCTYQWQEKYLGARISVQPSDIQTYFETDGWKFLGRDSIEFRHRRNERYWQSFLADVVCFQRLEGEAFVRKPLGATRVHLKDR